MWVYIEYIDEEGNSRYPEDFYFHPFIIQAEKGDRFAVGFFHPGSAKFIIESQHKFGYQARNLINMMNGASEVNEQ